jgi:carbamoyl-phosphate synthase large subunit
MNTLKIDANVMTADMVKEAAAAYFSKKHFIVPKVTDPVYVDALLELCEASEVGLLVPTIDPELPILAAARDRFEEIGVLLCLSGEQSVAIADDKRTTNKFMQARQLSCPSQWDLTHTHPEVTDYPVVVKPARGSRSVGVNKAYRREQLEFLCANSPVDLVAESVACGQEFTVSVFVAGSGRIVAAVPRARVQVRDGEVSKSLTKQISPVENLARRLVEALPDPYGPLNVQVFHDAQSDATQIIELNARFGGGDPLAWRAGARMPHWLIQDWLGMEIEPPFHWESELAMLRFDDAIYVSDCRSL